MPPRSPGREEDLRPQTGQQRAQAPLRQAAGQARHRPRHRRPGRLHRRPAPDRRPRARLHIAHLPGLTMRRIADLYSGEAKTDAKDAFIIADAAHTLRISTTRRSPSRRWSSASKSPACPTGFAACLHRSTRIWNRSWARACNTRPCSDCWTSSARRPQIRKAGRRRPVAIVLTKFACVETTGDGRGNGMPLSSGPAGSEPAPPSGPRLTRLAQTRLHKPKHSGRRRHPPDGVRRVAQAPAQRNHWR